MVNWMLSPTTTHRETRCGTSVSGPLNMVNDDSFDWTPRADNQAMLEGPGASLASKEAEFPPILTDPGVQVKSGFEFRSGILEAMEAMLAD
jgi:hypothetical protein